MTRDEVSRLMLAAKTLEQCAEAWKIRAFYLQEHPGDEGILEEGEALYMKEQALKYESQNNAQPRQVA